jgi:hypothetical protein
VRTPILVTGFCLFVISMAYADDAKPKNDRNPWNGFGIGSWVIESESMTKDGKTQTRREKQTRVEATKLEGIQIQKKAEGKKNGVFDGPLSDTWHIPGLDPALDPKIQLVNIRQEDLTIQGKKYACEVKQYQFEVGAEKTTATYWHCKDVKVPYREAPGPPRSMAMGPDVLRLDVDFQSKNETMKASTQVIMLEDERRVGNKKVKCVREEGNATGTEDGQKASVYLLRILSSEVPGHEVETLVKGEVAGMKFRVTKQIEAFEVVN